MNIKTANQQTISSGQILALTIQNSALPELLSGVVLPEQGGNKTLYINNKEVALLMLKTDANEQIITNQFRLVLKQNAASLGTNILVDISRLSHDNQVAAIRGLAMNEYNLGFFKSEKPKFDFDELTIFVEGSTQEIISLGTAQAHAQTFAMALVDRPGGQKTPQFIANAAKDIFKNKKKISIKTIEGDALVDKGLHALYAVGRGSINPSVLLVVEYKGAPETNDWHTALIGKGVTFDTGGVSIKPSTNLHYMKSDMAGGAAMLGAIVLAEQTNLPINIVALIPAAENVVDANSFLPGDVISSYAGISIEVIDTDAEGRLILADALAWAEKNYAPEIMVDMATLTGSSVRTMATEAACLYSTHIDLEKDLRKAGEKTGERLWPMPLWPEYDKYLESDVADVKNLPSIPAAGSITAAKFLQKFINNHQKWAHIDMPGMAFQDSPFTKMKAATGYGVMLMWNFLHNLALQLNNDKK